MAKKRIQKKSAKRQEVKALLGAGYTPKQIKKIGNVSRETIATPIISKNETKQKISESYKKRQKYIDRYNVQGVSKTNSWSDIKKARERQEREQAKKVQAEKRRKQRQELRRKKVEYLEGKGYKREDIPASVLNSSWDKVKEWKPFQSVFVCDEYLYAGWADKSDSTYLYYSKDFYSGMDEKALSRSIGEVMDYKSKKGSSGKAGDTIIYMSRSYDNCLVQAEFNEIRHYQTLCISNEWTIKGYLNLCAFILDNAPESKRGVLHAQLKQYARENMREVYEYLK